jgi:hypothetical protein
MATNQNRESLDLLSLLQAHDNLASHRFQKDSDISPAAKHTAPDGHNIQLIADVASPCNQGGVPQQCPRPRSGHEGPVKYRTSFLISCVSNPVSSSRRSRLHSPLQLSTSDRPSPSTSDLPPTTAPEDLDTLVVEMESIASSRSGAHCPSQHIESEQTLDRPRPRNLREPRSLVSALADPMMIPLATQDKAQSTPQGLYRFSANQADRDSQENEVWDTLMIAPRSSTFLDIGDDSTIQDHTDSMNNSDAGYESETTSETSTSLESSVLDYVFENGRRYHRFREGLYPFPNDEAEQEREGTMHVLASILCADKLHYAPIVDHPQEVLDLGTGTGVWAIESMLGYDSPLHS